MASELSRRLSKFVKRPPSTRLIRFPKAGLISAGLSRSELELLIETGLPESAPPMLSFGPSGSSVSTVEELYGVRKSHLVIGADGEGNPLCLSVRNAGNVVQVLLGIGGKERFVNTSVIGLVESILAFVDLDTEATRENGADALMDWDIPSQVLSRCRDRIREVDARALRKGAFWRLALEE